MSTVIKYPKIVYFPRLIVVDATNNKIDFEETAASELTATIPAGIYTVGEYRFQVKKAMEAVGVSSYTVDYSHTTKFFKLTSNGSGGGGIFTVLWSTGTNSAASAGVTMGYAVSDLTGALTYTAVTQTPLAQTLIFTRFIRRPTYQTIGRQNNLISVSGTNETAFLRNDHQFSFTLEFVEQADLQAWHDFMEDSYLAGGQFDYYPDNADNASHIALIGDAKSFNLREMVAKGLIGFWTFTVSCRVVESSIDTPAAASTITFNELSDRINV